MASEAEGRAAPRAWRTAGPWLAALIAAMMVYNAWQAFSDPAAFAARFGLAGAADADAGFVLVYASRALFLAQVTALFVATGQWRALTGFALVAILMPVADAAQVASAGGPASIIGRHVAIAVYLAVTAAFLHRLNRRER
jgi:hypothetical protein